MKNKSNNEKRILKIFGLAESEINKVLKDFSEKYNSIQCEMQGHLAETHIILKPLAGDSSKASRDLDNIEKEIKAFAGVHVFAYDDQNMEGVVGNLLNESKRTLSVAESCTGGLIGSRLTDIPGSSSYFMGGVIVYNNQAKIALLDVLKKTLDENGAVSRQVVIEMAKGVRNKLRSDLGVAVTGIAGPDGGSAGKPVGTVCIGLASGYEAFSERYLFYGTREQIKGKSASMALDWVRRYLNGDKVFPGI